MVAGTTTTGLGGTYTFSVPPGTYVVSQANIPPFFDISDADGGDPNSIAVDVSGADSTSNEFLDSVCPANTTEFRVPTIAEFRAELNARLNNPALYPGLPDLAIDEVEEFAPNSAPSTPPPSTAPFRTISGQVLQDVNADNVGDTPIPAVTLTVIDTDGIIVATTLTDTNGDFTVEVPSGLYSVFETNNPGVVDVSDSDGGDPNVINVDVTSSDSAFNVFVDA